MRWAKVHDATDSQYFLCRCRCEVPGCDNGPNSVYHPEWLNNTVPFKHGIPTQCGRFQPISNASLDNLLCDADDFDQKNIIECGSFIFEDDEVTIVNDFNITCPNNDWKLTLVGTINNVGQFVALPIAGYISDRFGRRLVLLLSVAGSAIFGVIRSFAASYEMFIALEFLDPLIGSTMYTTAFVLALELVGPKMRVTGNNIISCAFSFAEAGLGLLAMLLRNWRYLLRALYIPGIVSLPFLWMTTESVRWLLSKGQREKAFDVLKRAAKMNGKTLSPAAIDSFCPVSDNESRSEMLENNNFFNLLTNAFKNRRLILRVANCSFCWLTNVLVYFGLSLNSVTLAGDKYLNFILVSLVELPGFLIMQLILDRVGRRVTLCTTMILCGLFCFLSEFIPTGNMATLKPSFTGWAGVIIISRKWRFQYISTTNFIFNFNTFRESLAQPYSIPGQQDGHNHVIWNSLHLHGGNLPNQPSTKPSLGMLNVRSNRFYGSTTNTPSGQNLGPATDGHFR